MEYESDQNRTDGRRLGVESDLRHQQKSAVGEGKGMHGQGAGGWVLVVVGLVGLS